MKRRILLVILIFISLGANAQKQLREGWWRVELLRTDSIIIPFNFEVKMVNGKEILFIRNVSERIKVDQLRFKGDSVFIEMPVFESRFAGKFLKNGSIEGNWIKGTSSKDQVLPFRAVFGFKDRFLVHHSSLDDISGRWAVNFVSSDTSERMAIAEFEQEGNELTGTFLTTTGDYRFLEGAVNGDKLLLSTFDGSHAYFFRATIDSSNKISNGHYYSGARGHQQWTAVRDPNAHLPEDASAVYLEKAKIDCIFLFLISMERKYR